MTKSSATFHSNYLPRSLICIYSQILSSSARQLELRSPGPMIHAHVNRLQCREISLVGFGRQNKILLSDGCKLLYLILCSVWDDQVLCHDALASRLDSPASRSSYTSGNHQSLPLLCQVQPCGHGLRGNCREGSERRLESMLIYGGSP